MINAPEMHTSGFFPASFSSQIFHESLSYSRLQSALSIPGALRTARLSA